MKRRLTTREKVMIGVLAVASIVMYRMMAGDGIGFGGAAPNPVEARDFGKAPEVRMDMLSRAAAEFDEKGRNLFAYYVPPRKAAPQPIKREIPQPPPVKRDPKPPPPPPLPLKPTAPLPGFEYLGYLGPKDARIAVFEQGSEDGVLLARVGDVLEKRFQLLGFTHDSVRLGYTEDQWQGRTTELQMAGLR
jgi:hypothetical protein